MDSTRGHDLLHFLWDTFYPFFVDTISRCGRTPLDLHMRNHATYSHYFLVKTGYHDWCVLLSRGGQIAGKLISRSPEVHVFYMTTL